MTKTCSKCNTEKDFDCFNKNKAGLNGLHSWCRICMKSYQSDHYQKNKESKSSYAKLYNAKNKAKNNKASSEYYFKNKKRTNARTAKYYKDNKHHLNNWVADYNRERRQSDPSFRLADNLRRRARAALNGERKSATTRKMLGCSFEQARAYIEAQFTDGMSWDNYGRHGWHIDHIIPCASFDLTDPEQQRKCFHYTNLQPLWAEDNLRKSDKLPHKI